LLWYAGIMKSDFYVYIYFEPDTLEPFYVGKGRGRRARSHLKTCFNPRDLNYNNPFYRTLRKRLQNQKIPAVVIVANRLTNDEAVSTEQDFIRLLGRRDRHAGPLWNLTDGGEGPIGRVISEETRRRIGLAKRGRRLSLEQRAHLRTVNLGRTASEETKKRMSVAQLGRKMSESVRQRQLGRICTEATRRRIRQAHLGHPVSEESRQKMRAAKLGRKASEDVRKRMSNAFKGRKHTEATLAKMRLAATGRTPNQATCKKMAKAKSKGHVSGFDACLTLVGTYDSAEATRWAGYNPICVRLCLRGKSKTHKGLIWKYTNKQEQKCNRNYPLDKAQVSDGERTVEAIRGSEGKRLIYTTT